MITQEKARDLLGAQACDPQGAELGMVEAIYVDDQTNRPEFAAVRLSGDAGSLVPLAAAQERDGALRVAYPRSQIRDAPTVTADENMSQEQEAELYAYYGLDYTVTGTDQETVRLHRTADGAATRGTVTERHDVWVERDPIAGEAR